jgi:glycosyltransferase involved in cell wall biosynthesis
MTSGRAGTVPVSIITPVFDPEPAHLAACLDSVRRQTTGNLEHILVDDGSTRADVVDMLRAAADERHVRLISRVQQGGIVAATNDGLAAAVGEFVAFLDHDDVLHHDAVETMLAAVDRPDRGQRPGTPVVAADVVYSDHDFLDADGEHLGPCLKPQWSPERLRNQNYITHFVMARRSLIDEVGGIRSGFDGAQDHDLMLRLGERARRIAHVPEILYHWRQAPSSVAAGGDAKPWAFDAGRRAVQEHCDRIGLDATVERTTHEGIYRIDRKVPDPAPLVSVLVPTRGSSGKVWGVTRNFVVEAVRSIVDHSTYPNLEFVVVVDDDTPAPVIAALHDVCGDRLTLVEHHGVFNFSVKMNEGAAAASGEYLLFLNDDTELIEPTSIETLVGLVSGPAEGLDGSAGEVGMAGAKLLFDDGTIQHGGHIYFYGPHHACTGWSGTSPGPLPLKPLSVERECSGVTAAVALVRADVYDEIGGFPEELPLNYNDVDFSLKIRASGRRIVWTPHACWYHFESRTRVGKVIPEETAFIHDRWATEIDNDPYYNPRLSPQWFDWLEWPIDEPMQVGVVRDHSEPSGLFGKVRDAVASRLGRG